MAEKVALPAAAAGWVRWLRRLVPVVLVLVGLVFLASGGWMLLSQRWDRATGTLGACTVRTERIGTGTSTRTEHVCDVTWQVDATSHTGSVTLVRGAVSPGQAIDLRVHGDTVVEASPAWAGAATGGVGVVLIAAAAVVLIRSRRRPG